jgi:hypothetical protein
MLSDCFHHVFGAGWIEPARRGQQGRHKSLVDFKNANQDSLHRAKILPTSRHKSSNGASRTLPLGLNTIAQFAGTDSMWLRTASLIRRFSRFRFTALPKLRGAVNPNRAGIELPSVRKQNAAKYRLVIRVPVS